MPFHVKSATPIGSESQCVTCKFSMLLRDFAKAKRLTYCDFLTQPILVSFQVRECSRYVHRSRRTFDQMEELAIEIRPSPTLKPAGFMRGDEVKNEAAVAKVGE